ncbi:MAG TPA: hypothetical protein VHB21_01035, partial [Minicystis sp.]|nr:hypothetical protein [Minicystis sp.]
DVIVRTRRFGATLEARYDVAAGAALGGGHVAAQLATGAVLPCVYASLLVACAEGSLGALTGSSDASAGVHHTTVFAGAGARAGLELPLFGPVSARAEGDFEATLTRTTLYFAGRPVWTSPPVFGSVGLLALVRMP